MFHDVAHVSACFARVIYCKHHRPSRGRHTTQRLSHFPLFFVLTYLNRLQRGPEADGCQSRTIRRSLTGLRSPNSAPLLFHDSNKAAQAAATAESGQTSRDKSAEPGCTCGTQECFAMVADWEACSPACTALQGYPAGSGQHPAVAELWSCYAVATSLACHSIAL